MFDLSPIVALHRAVHPADPHPHPPGQLLSDARLPEWLTLRDDGVTVAVKAVPRSRATRAVGLQDGALRVQIAAAPHRGQSNAALCAYLAERPACGPRRPASGADPAARAS